jgi:hypothetical protein
MIREFIQKFRIVKEAAAALYRRDNGYFIYSDNKTTVGAWIGVEPCIFMPLESTHAQLGTVIRECLKRSKVNVAHPKEFKGGFNFVLKTAKVRSYKQFMLNCRHCTISQKGEKLIFTHTINDGTKGFSYTKEPSIEINISCSDAVLGEKALECIDKSK